MRIALVAALVVAVAVAVVPAAVPAGARVAAPPNIVVIETGAQTPESVRVMTRGVQRLALGGTTFSDAFATDPRCCAGRAALLTGQYAHSSGVWSDEPADSYSRLDPARTVAPALERAGYETAFVGEYVDGYAEAAPLTVPPGWDEWYAAAAAPDGEWNYAVNDNGVLVPHGSDAADYAADVFSTRATDLATRFAASDRPFLLWVSYPGGRSVPEPPPRYAGALATEPFPASAAFNEADVSDKPPFVRELPPLDAGAVSAAANDYRRRLESLLAVDDGVASVVAALRAAGKLDSTLVVYTATTGVMQGEHRIVGQHVTAYEPAVRVPLILRGPGVPHDATSDDLAANVDVAPTILAAAGITPEHSVDGTSLLPLAGDRLLQLGRDVLLESRSFTGLRTPRYKYVRYVDGSEELYDLAVDPNELRNRRADTAYAAVRSELRRRLAALRGCAGAACLRGPRLELRLTLKGRALRGCAAGSVSASIAGADVRAVGQVDFYEADLRIRRDQRPPFQVALLAPGGFGGQATVRARIFLSDGRRVTLVRTVAAC